jgi:hypothetical protein
MWRRIRGLWRFFLWFSCILYFYWLYKKLLIRIFSFVWTMITIILHRLFRLLTDFWRIFFDIELILIFCWWFFIWPWAWSWLFFWTGFLFALVPSWTLKMIFVYNFMQIRCVCLSLNFWICQLVFFLIRQFIQDFIEHFRLEQISIFLVLRKISLNLHLLIVFKSICTRNMLLIFHRFRIHCYFYILCLWTWDRLLLDRVKLFRWLERKMGM